MPVKNTQDGKIHKGSKGGSTGCGFDTTEFPHHWVASSEKVTCDKNGCKN